ISRMVINRFNEEYDIATGELDLYYLDLHSFRPVSNEIGELFQVRHESPQLLVVKDGAVVAHESHNGISQLDLKKYV
ncbi:MAG TPA: bacillithiol system redox-active protein YtxJ, partial [Arenibacter sp.]|nr:bacillithiol system redox-active protein YtxJ [Arenibacter sp.]